MNINKVGFIGLGLIGGSIAKAIKKFYPSTTIIAQASRESTIVSAYNDGLIKNDKLLSSNDFNDCDVIFLCCPVQINAEYMRQLKDIIKPSCILTDVGSVKGDITKIAQELNITNQFIGGHPMTGSEHIGYDYSNENLLENSYYILTYDEKIDSNIVKDFEKYISSLGPLTLTMSPTDHDLATAKVSHVPHVIASALVNMLKNTDDELSIGKTIAAGGFKDTTRIASSSPVMWEHICMTNKDAILDTLASFKNELDKFEKTIREEDAKGFNQLFTEGKNYRDSLTVNNNKKTITMVHELYTYIDDAQGTILPVLVILNDAKISIKNMDIVHNREYEPGVLRLEFYTDDALQLAAKVLAQKDYEIHIRK